VVSRSGMPGMQRYVQTWSGDNYTEWKTLRYNLAMALNLSLSGMSHTGHDIGGFSGPLPSPELFLRWIQHGIFYPRFVIHSWKEGRVNEPWMYPQVLPEIKAAFALREALTPYLYQSLLAYHENYEAVLRPLFYNFPKEDRSYSCEDQFMLGDSLLVANILEPGLKERRVWLPTVPEAWCEFATGQWYDGGQELLLPVDSRSIPFFVRGSTILPLQNKGRIELKVFAPPNYSGLVEGEYFEDDGLSFPFARSGGSTVKIKLEFKKGQIVSKQVSGKSLAILVIGKEEFTL